LRGLSALLVERRRADARPCHLGREQPPKLA